MLSSETSSGLGSLANSSLRATPDSLQVNPGANPNLWQLELLVDHPERALAVCIPKDDAFLDDISKAPPTSRIGVVRDICSERELELVVVANEREFIRGQIVSKSRVTEPPSVLNIFRCSGGEKGVIRQPQTPFFQSRAVDILGGDVSLSPAFLNYELAQQFLIRQHRLGFRGVAILQGQTPKVGGGTECSIIAEGRASDNWLDLRLNTKVLA